MVGDGDRITTGRVLLAEALKGDRIEFYAGILARLGLPSGGVLEKAGDFPFLILTDSGMLAPAVPISITGIGPMCPDACSVAELRAGPRARPQGPGWFQVENHLGPKGFKYLTPATRFLLAAARQAIEDAKAGEGVYPADKKGVVVGTNFASYRVAEQLDQCMREGGAEAIQPMDAPNFSVNIPASWVSIRHHYQAFNLTFTEPVVAGLNAVLVGSQAAAAGRADVVLAAATEDQPPRSAAALLGLPEAHAGACAVLLERLETAAAREAIPYAIVSDGFLGCARGSHVWERLRGWLTRMISDHLQEAAVSIPCCVTAALDRRDNARLATVLSEVGPPLALVAGFGSEARYVSVSPVLQLAYLATVYGRGLVIAGGPDGQIVGVGLRAPPRSGTCNRQGNDS